jgi:hypothetical protein
MLWPMIVWSSWDQPANMVACTASEDGALACLFGLRGLSQPLWWRARQMRTLLWPLFDRSAWAVPVTVVAGTRFDGAELASVRLVGVSPASHCGDEHHR